MTTDTDVLVFVQTLYGEARGEPTLGQVAVAWVILNRGRLAAAYRAAHHGLPHPLFGNGTVASACLVPEQFSCWNENDPNRAKLEEITDPAQQPALAAVAKSVLGGAVQDPTDGATHYVVTSVVRETNWTKGATATAEIGHHTFYKDVP